MKLEAKVTYIPEIANQDPIVDNIMEENFSFKKLAPIENIENHNEAALLFEVIVSSPILC